jgi:hypothetical protein
MCAFICYLINLLSHRLSGAAHPYNLDQLISEDGTVTIEQPIMSAEEGTIHHFLLSSSASATMLLPGQDKPAPSGPHTRRTLLQMEQVYRSSQPG